MPWPPRSPGITLWDYVKSSVFRTPVNGLDDLKTRIGNTNSAIPADMLQRTWQELENRLDVLRATKRGLIMSVKKLPVSLYSAANRMWLAQFACAPQFSKPGRDFVDTLYMGCRNTGVV
jgi:hypothetical protein